MKLILSIVLLAASSACGAAEPVMTKQYEACMSASDGVTVGMLDCIADETRRQDAKLNVNFKAAMVATPKARQPKLRDAQRNWIKFRDSDCAFLSDPDGGTAAAVDSASCILTATAERAKSLADLAEMMSVR